MSTKASTLLRLTNVRKSFDGHIVLDGITCEFSPGAICTILGESGSGKTTLLRLIAGLESADAGRVEINGQDLTEAPPAARQIAFVFQDLSLYSHLTVHENLMLPLRARGVAREAADRQIRETCRQFGLERLLPRRADSLSGGEAQRLTLAKAIVRHPALMLMDEPFGHLDVHLRREARDFVLDVLRRESITTILVSHDHEDAQMAGGPVLALDRGRIAQIGPWRTLFEKPATAHVAHLVSFFRPLAIPGRIDRDGAESVFRAEELGLTIPLSEEHGTVGRAVVYWRPELLQAGPARHTASALSGQIESLVMLGPAAYARVRHPNGLLFEARLNQGSPAEAGDPVSVDLGMAAPILLDVLA